MDLEPIAPVDLEERGDTHGDAAANLAAFLLGEGASAEELPSLTDLATALVSLAIGRQPKHLLPLAEAPLEVALVRTADSISVSLYETGAAPEVVVLDRRVRLTDALSACATAMHALVRSNVTPSAMRGIAERLAERVETAVPAPAEALELLAVERSGGQLTEPSDGTPLAFGFRARIPRGSGATHEMSSRADVHALLFSGELFAWARGRRVLVARGPIMLAIGRMIAAVRALADAWDAGRTVNVRLGVGGFAFGVRLDGDVSLTLGSDRTGQVTIPALDVPEAVLPVLRLASDVLRALLAVDRSQSKNLRVRALRDEVRSLRRRVRARHRERGFVNRDADRLRAALVVVEEAGDAGTRAAPVVLSSGRLRFVERWTAEVDELDAASTFLCGDRLVIAGARRAVALDRDDGSVLWAREGLGGPSHMAGTTLVRRAPDGLVELCRVGDGEPFATCRLSGRTGGAPIAAHIRGDGVPPTVVLSDGDNRLVAIDLRNGEQRFGYEAPGPGPIRARRAGRLLLVASGDGTLDAIDTVAGVVVWRFAARARFTVPPVVAGDTVIAAGSAVGARDGCVHGVDLYSGEMRFTRSLPAPPVAPPIVAGRVVLLALGARRRGSITAIDGRTGTLLHSASDPGIGLGGAFLVVDRLLLVNAPGGQLTALSIDDGVTRWSHALSDPLADDVPRRLEPILRGGALFVPAAHVHVLRPSDGSPLAATLPCSLVPDLLRVDERGWVYVAEESGFLGGYAPAPHLALVR